MTDHLQHRRDEHGFTLVELLVVIVILGILAAVVVFAVGGITDKGDASAKKTDESTLATAEESYFAQQPAPATYTFEANLVPKWLRQVSSLNDICVSADKLTYAIVPAGTVCAAGFSTS